MSDPQQRTNDGPRRRFDWRLIALWTAGFLVSTAVQTHSVYTDAARAGVEMSAWMALALEGTGHVAVGALVPAMYWLHRRWPLLPQWRRILLHVAAVVPFSLAHIAGIAILRWLLFSLIAGSAYRYRLSGEQLLYEGGKDIITYTTFVVLIIAFDHLLGRTRPTPDVASPSAGAADGRAAMPAPATRFAVRKGGKEVLIDVADIAWIEAAGNYAVLHVGGERYEMRSSLTKLEAELDPQRFVRVHKSYMVNVHWVREVEPWMSGDWRIRMTDGAQVSLSRRYRARFEAAVPVKS
jgi:hypothetical protein